MKPSVSSHRLVKISQAAEILGVSIDTLRRWEASGKITPIRTPGGTRLYCLEDLQKINPKIISHEPTEVFELMKLPNLNQSESSTSEDNQNNVTHHINLPHYVSNLALIAILFSLLTTAFIFLFYLYFPEGTTRFLTPQNSIQTDLSFRNFVTDILHSASLKALSPFNQLAKRMVVETFPRTAHNIALDASKNPSSLPTTSSNFGNVLGVSGADRYLEINTEAVIKGSLAVSDEINGFTLTPGANGANISDKANNNSLTFSGNINLNQPLSTTSSPTFANLTLTATLNVPTLKLSATSNQIVFNTNGTLTWAPSSAKTLTLPDVTGTLITKDSTDTLSNKTIKSSDSNTISGSFTGITGLGTITAGTWNGTKIAIGYGGTGLTSYTTGDILYASASDTLSKLTIGSSGQLLTISGGVPAWSTVSGVGGATGTGTSGQITFWNGTSTLTGSNSLWWDSANGNLGIGTTSPGNKLTVNGNVGIGTTAFTGNLLTVTGGNVGIGTTAAVGNLLTVNGNVGIGTTAFVNARLSVMTGNVGIGTTSPSYFLDVSGNIHTTKQIRAQYICDELGASCKDLRNTRWSRLAGDGTVSSSSKIASGTGGGPTLVNTDYFGESVSNIGDLNGDGVEDLAVGAVFDDTGGTNRGAVYILFMNTSGTVSSSSKIASGTGGGPTLADGDRFGASIADIGDLNSDGVQDLAVGVQRANSVQGAVYVLFMNTNGTVSSSVQIASGVNGGPTLADNDNFGQRLSNIGDLNGDGVEDLAVGAYGDDTGGANRGAVYVLFMKTDGTVSSSVKIASGTGGGPTLANTDYFNGGTGIGDLNGDGVEDMVAGAFEDDTGGTNRGAIYVLFMNTNGTVSSSVKIASGTGGGPTLSDSDRFGDSIGNMGDLNGDGVEDLAVGAYTDDTGGTDRGAVYVLFMKTDGTVSSSVKIASGTGGGPTLTDSDYFGRDVSNIGDLNGDGVEDLAVGAYGDDTNGTDRGAVYVLFMAKNNIYFASQNVGIGTTNPGNLLTINGGNVGIGTTAFVNSALSVMGGNVGIGTTTAGTSGKLTLVGTGTAEGFNFRVQDSNFADKFLILDNGNVGIGTTNPGNLLTVNGNVGIGTTAFVNAGLSVMTGNVGFGTTAPGEKLEVAGNIKPATNVSYNLGTQSLDTTADATVTGDTNNLMLGGEISNAGDVNGDGYVDLLVGASTNGSIAGRAYIYYGSSSMNLTSDITLSPNSSGDDFGYATSSAGDFNGDGFADVIVGASTEEVDGLTSATDDGKAYIYYGGASMDTTADVIISAAAAGDRLGISVANAGDVNSDGYSDVIVGASKADNGGTNRGEAYLFYGGPSVSSSISASSADITLKGTTNSIQLGAAVRSAGDLNGDGYSDVAVAAVNNVTGSSKVFVFYGGPNLSSSINDSSANVTYTGESTADLFGISVDNGDINGDGYTDLMVGADLNDNSSLTDNGRTYVFYGGPNLSSSIAATSADVTLNGSVGNGAFGIALRFAGDINGDGYGDIMISEPMLPGEATAGKVYIYYGGASMNTTADITFNAENAGDNFGMGDGATGDFNGDGYLDAITGATGDDTGGTNRGKVYFYQGSGNRWQSTFAQNLNISRGLQIDNLMLDRRGLNSGPNLFGLTTPDWSISRYGTASFQNLISRGNVGIGTANPGNLLTIFGGNVGIGTTAFVNAGLSIMTGNVGIGTTAPGEKLEVDGNIKPKSNTSYNIGTQSLDTTADVTFAGGGTNRELGIDVKSAGDVNGDNYDDLIIGGPTAGGGQGAAYIYYGSSTVDNTADVTLSPASTGDDFGYATSSAGDFNGDGFADVIVGASTEEVDGLTGATDDGKAYIYYGGASMDTTADVTLSAAVAGDRFGIAVANAGDVNGDGYSDVIVGAYMADAGGTNRGEAYIFYGGPSVSSSISASSANLTLSGAANNDAFGASVNAAGDINSDGYGDVIVGAFQAEVSGLTAAVDDGTAYIFYGGSNMDSTVDVTLNAAVAGDQFAMSVGSAGDINGDGIADVIVGAVKADAGGTDRGAAYIFYGSKSLSSTISASSANVTLSGEADNDNLGGRHIGTAGDINGDGYSDVIVGADQGGSGSSYNGKAYIFYGGSSMNAIADISFTGEAVGDSFGFAVAAAGDPNGDGYPDVLIGASFNDPGGLSAAGEAYLYQGSGNRWQSMFAQNLNVSRGLQIDSLLLDRWGLGAKTFFGITTPNWEIDRLGSASFQNLISQGNVGIGTANPGNLLTINGGNVGIGTTASVGNLLSISGGNVGIGTTAFVNAALSVMGGNVGIGTTSPASLLQLRAATGSDPSFSLADADVGHGVTTIAPTDDFFRLTPISSTVGGAFLNGLADADGIALQLRGIQSATPTDSTPAIKLIGAKASGTGVQDLDAIETIFQIANNDDAAAFTILGNGNVGIGTTGPSAKLDVAGSTATIANSSGDLTITPASDLVISQGNVGIGTTAPAQALEVTGRIAMGTWTADGDTAVYKDDATGALGLTTSDIRLKKNLDPIQNALGIINQLTGYKYNNLDDSDGTKKRLGVIAQDLLPILPEATFAFTGGDGQTYYSVHYEKLTALLIQGIREQQDEINTIISQQSNTANTLGNLALNNDGSLTAPEIRTNKLTISADINLNAPALASLLTRTSGVGSDSPEVDVLASLNAISSAVLGIQTQDSSTSAQLANLQDQTASQSSVIANISEAISSQSAALAQNQTATLSLAEQLASAAAELVKTRSEVDDLKLTPPELLFSTSSATLANLNITSDASISGKLAVYQTTVSDTFKSLGETLLGRTTIAGDLAVDGTLSLTGNSLNSISTLYIQNSALAGSVDFFNGLVTIDNNGSLIAQTISTNAVITNKLTISNTPVSSASASTSDTNTPGVGSNSRVSAASIGSGKIPASQIKVPVLTTAISPTSKVFITPKSSTLGQTPFIELIQPGTGFVVSIDNPVSRDIDFDWWIVDTK